MTQLKDIDDEPILQCGSEVDRMLAHHILALERAHNEREARKENEVPTQADSAQCECGHFAEDHHAGKFSITDTLARFGCVQCGCSDFRLAEQEHREAALGKEVSAE